MCFAIKTFNRAMSSVLTIISMHSFSQKKLKINLVQQLRQIKLPKLLYFLSVSRDKKVNKKQLIEAHNQLEVMIKKYIQKDLDNLEADDLSIITSQQTAMTI
jgi:hypothetical protein